MSKLNKYISLGGKVWKEMLLGKGIKFTSKEKVAGLADLAMKGKVDLPVEEDEQVEEKEKSEGELMQEQREGDGLPVEVRGVPHLEFYREGCTYILSKEDAKKQGFIK